ncbi:unnamed protein product, partial [Meganyctiphanes norvegica]
MAIQMNISGIRRNLKNVAHNYTDAQVKVREATSNDPWGPSSTVMSEVADLTYNVVAFSEIMQMIWKRLNDHGRNWRHVYKALVLLEYLIKTGSEKVADQCKENIFAIQTLKDFQYIEENKDQGMNVREKAKGLVSLLKDDERLRNERVRALKAKERFAQSLSAIGSDSDISSPTSPSFPDTFVTSTARPEGFGVRDPRDPPITLAEKAELEAARPQTVGEEELQLQLALAMSKEEAEQEEQRRKSDDVRLQMALSQSEETGDDLVPGLLPQGTSSGASKLNQKSEDVSGMNDLLDINFNPSSAIGGNRSLGSSPLNTSSIDPWGMPAPQPVSPLTVSQPKSDPWGGSPISGPPSRVASPPTTNDPWAPAQSRSPIPEVMAAPDPWAPVSSSPLPQATAAPPIINDPWNPVSDTSVINSSQAPDPFAPLSPNGDLDEFSALSTRDKHINNGILDDMELIGSTPNNNGGGYQPPKSKSPAAFLGDQVHLVNLDNLVSGKQPQPAMGGVPLLSSSTSISPLPITTNNNNNHLITNNNINSINNNPFAVPPMTGNIGMLSNSAFTGVSNPFSPSQPPNPFQAAQAPKPSMNQLRTTGVGIPGSAIIPPTANSDPWGTPAPAINTAQEDNRDPFFF